MLAGCTDDEPDPPPPTSSTPSSPTSTEPTDSPSPDPESAADFIRRWVEEDIKMQNTGETSTYRRMSAGCRPCRDFADLIEKYYANGGFVETEGWKVLAIRKAAGGGASRPTYVVKVDSRPTRFQEHKGGPIKDLPGERTSYRVSLRERTDSWQVTYLIEVAT